MIRVRFLLKDGREICVDCKEVELEVNRLYNSLVSYSLKGIQGEYPMYLNIGEVIAVLKEDYKEVDSL